MSIMPMSTVCNSIIYSNRNINVIKTDIIIKTNNLKMIIMQNNNDMNVK